MASSSADGRNMAPINEQLYLEEEEAEVLRVPVAREEEVAIDTRWCLVGKLLTGRVSGFNVFQNMMTFLWQPGMGIASLGSHPRPTIVEEIVGQIGQNHGMNNSHLHGIIDSRNPSDGILGINGEDAALNVNNNGNFFDSDITTIVDSKRKRPGHTFVEGMGLQGRTLDDIMEDGMERIKTQLGFEGCFVVDSHGHSGGLALLWKFVKEVEIQGFSFHHIDALIHLHGYSTWRLTGIYGEPRREFRTQTWDMFRSLKNTNVLSWCLIGDMNNLGDHSEKRGGRKYPDWLIDGFREVLSECELIDMPFQGYPFTWEKGRNSDNWIEERLDKALVNNGWLNLFSQASLFNLEVSTSDHCPLLLVFQGTAPQTTFSSFRFKNAWLRKPMCKVLVESCWVGSGNCTIQEKIWSCGEVLGKWGKDITGSFKKRIAECKAQI
uniref:Endonuclease/exonuclease/phosphatase domain-containing protein n=1 Tax=Cannabis sativa TaxID=3483 RepID=A0A803PGL7_CANSA